MESRAFMLVSPGIPTLDIKKKKNPRLLKPYTGKTTKGADPMKKKI
jgi:hypothetical protein